jgi:hypothetical protein
MNRFMSFICRRAVNDAGLNSAVGAIRMPSADQTLLGSPSFLRSVPGTLIKTSE